MTPKQQDAIAFVFTGLNDSIFRLTVDRMKVDGGYSKPCMTTPRKISANQYIKDCIRALFRRPFVLKIIDLDYLEKQCNRLDTLIEKAEKKQQLKIILIQSVMV